MRPALAAYGAEDLAGGEAGFIRGEQDIERRELRGLACTSDGGVGAEFRQFVRRLAARNLQCRPYRPWRHGIYAYALLRQLLGQSLGEDHDRALGGGVIDDVLARILGVHRGRVDDRSARF